MIATLVNDFIKEIGISAILTKKIFRGILDIHYCNWFGTDGKYYSLLAPCSETMIYSVNTTDLFGCYNSHDVLLSNLRTFDTMEEWRVGKWERAYAENYSKALESAILLREGMSLAVGNYTLVKCKFYVQPCLGVTVWYRNMETEKITCFTAWKGSITVLKTADPLFQEFVEAIGIKDCIQLEIIHPDPLQIEMRYDYDS